MMWVSSAKIKLLLMSLVWVRILIPLSINYIISISGNLLAEFPCIVNAEGGRKLYGLLTAIWIAGIIIIFLYNIVAGIRLRNRLSTSIPQKLLIRNERVKVYRNDYINSALVYGVIRPKIYIAYGVNDNEIEYLYEHECMHIRHMHHIIKIIVSIATAINWFNPLLWIFYKCYMEYIELVCDYECCSKHRGEENWHKDYARILLKFSYERNMTRVRVLGFNNNYRIIQNRVKNIMIQEKLNIRNAVISFLLMLVIIMLLFIKPKIQIVEAEDIAIDSINSVSEEVEQEELKPGQKKQQLMHRKIFRM